MTKLAQRFEAVVSPGVEQARQWRYPPAPRPGPTMERTPRAAKPWKDILFRERSLLRELLAWVVCAALLLTGYAVSWRFVPL